MAEDTTKTAEQLIADNASLMAEIAALKAAAQHKLGCKVSDKGALSVYGLGRFPVTLYRSQWERLLAPETVAKINGFMADNAATLKSKE